MIEGKEGMEIGGEGSDRGKGRDGDWGRFNMVIVHLG